MEILASLGGPSYVVQRVREQEVIYLRPMPQDESDAIQSIDLAPLVRSGALQDISLTETEQETFVDLARQMDDGEAMTMAAAVHRGLALVTDDRVAKRIARSLSSPVEVVTTPAWVKRWADGSFPSAETISDVLKRIGIRAHYRPTATDPQYGWWTAHVNAN